MIDMFSLTSGIPKYYNNLLARTDKHLENSRAFLDGLHGQQTTSKHNYKDVPANATIRREDIKCGKPSCIRCPHGPYYYAYWKDEYGKLRKKYIGIKYEETWKSIKKRNKAIISLASH